MKVFRANKNAIKPVFDRPENAIFNLKACFEPNSKVRLINPLNKKTYTPTKIYGGKTCVQVYPQQRILIPTGLTFDVPSDCVLKLYSDPDVSNEKGLVLSNGVELIKFGLNEELHVMITNITDGVSVIETGGNIALGQLEKMLTYSISEITKLPSDDVAEDA
jgi:dUTPase